MGVDGSLGTQEVYLRYDWEMQSRNASNMPVR